MEKLLSIIIGSAVAAAGVVLLVIWWQDFLFLVRGCIPAMMILGGVIAVIAGVGEIKDLLKSK